MGKYEEEVGMPLKISVDLPYPNLSEVKKDVKMAAVIAPAYASMHGELNSLLQYLYHYFNFVGEGDEETADIIMGIALSEMHHLKILGELLFRLGVDPVFTKMPPHCYNYYTSENVRYGKTPIKMLIDDVASEIYAVKQYDKIVSFITDEKVSAVLNRIALDEEFHIKVLNGRINALGGDSVQKF